MQGRYVFRAHILKGELQALEEIGHVFEERPLVEHRAGYALNHLDLGILAEIALRTSSLKSLLQEALEAGGSKRYFGEDTKIKVVQGVSGAVLDKGSLFEYVPYLLQGLKLSFQDMGTKDIPTLHERLYKGMIRFEIRSASAQLEGGVHDMYSYKEPKYL